jgi:membrane protease YdiL (CAAX protease family)
MLRAPEHLASPTPARSPHEVVAVLIGAAFVAIWPFALSSFGRANVYAVMGPFAIVVIVVMAVIAKRQEVRLIVSNQFARDAAIGLGIGAAMTLGTYGAYAVAARLLPGLASRVLSLYVAASTEQLGLALAWTAIIAGAEELLWRGPLFEIIGKRWGKEIAIAILLGSYALAQLGSGSPIVMLAALVCGAIWTAERLFTKSLVAPLLSHLIWTIVVIHLCPVTRFG